MIFSEVYGSYFKAVSAILAKAVEGTLTEKELTRTVLANAFGESLITIPAKLTDGSWPLLTEGFGTPLRHAPHAPLTTLEKQWLKALLLDPRIRLFDPSEEGLEDVEPLFTPDQFVYFDRYADGDDFTDPRYIEHFRLIIRAMHEKRKLRVRFHGHRGTRQSYICIPYKLEYSSKDDKFRLITGFRNKPLTVNLSRIDSVHILEPWDESEYLQPREREKTLVMELYDSRNALERAMLHFSDLEKETERIDEKHYRITLNYKQGDETEILIRILSFGPVLKVIEPETMVKQIRERLAKQTALIGKENT
ncbi:MAG: WYL domain-containing protein [Oscillospiraceae bacterium]|nr:WYL domain-containing protein [Oscillospiraceae bacterium]